MVTVKCPHCGEEIEVNPGSLMGSISTPKKAASSARNGKKGGAPKGNKNAAKKAVKPASQEETKMAEERMKETITPTRRLFSRFNKGMAS